MSAVTTINTAAAKKAPTAASIPIPLVDAINAAPGVDHAVMIGIRCIQANTGLVIAMARHSTAIHDEVWALVAPTA